MIYPFICYECDGRIEVDAKAFCPPLPPKCESCRRPMERVYGCQIDTSGCRDHDDIPEASRVVEHRDFGPGKMGAAAKESAFQRHVSDRRKQLVDGGNRGAFRHTHSVPADLYHGKIRETGDKNYWSDPKNLKRHGSCKVG